MREDFLHFLWRWRRFNAQDLQTTDGQPLEIVHPGEPNAHAGPDFFNARIRIGDTLWAGNIEMHLRASEWLAHGHDADRAYDNVVLHVVLDEDEPIHRPDGQRLPCLALRSRIPSGLLEQYHRLLYAREWVPCAQRLGEVSAIVKVNWLDRLLVERLQEKTDAVARRIAETDGQWEEAFYRQLAHSFGLKINAETFEYLARIAPLSLLARHSDNRLQLEALLFGQAGLLEEAPDRDEYAQALAREYQFLRHKYQLRPLAASQWKFFRLRPTSFPTVRIAQLAAFLHRTQRPFAAVLTAAESGSIEQLFEVEVSPYWLTHYRFGKVSPARPKLLSQSFVHLLLINTVAPFLFHFGQIKGISHHQDQALRLLDALPPEDNSVLQKWAELGLKPQNAAQAQALLHLKTRYCQPQRCLECAIGAALLR
ncbi:MAG: DUF2851 family protein [Saprospiraceae bacterium]|nr:DUF2851 family protein [Saprospiraceae bacterium]MDW8229357.1 DUF2851 family protein [Saprospiraceae bacterium]